MELCSVLIALYMARKVNHLPFPLRPRGTSNYCQRHAIPLQVRQSCCKIN